MQYSLKSNTHTQRFFSLVYLSLRIAQPDSKVRGAYMGPIWSRQDLGGPHVGPMNFAISAAHHNSVGQTGKKLQWQNLDFELTTGSPHLKFIGKQMRWLF